MPQLFKKENKIPPQAQNNGLKLNTIYPEIGKLEAIELMLILQIIPIMFIVTRHKGAQMD